MLRKEQITSRQLIWLLFMAVIPTLALLQPQTVFTDAPRDAWMSAIVTPVLILILLWPVAKLAELYPGQTFVGYLKIILGQAGGGIVGVFIGLSLLVTSIIIARELAELTITIFFEATPLSFTIALGIIFVTWGVRSGVEVIARTNDAVTVTFFIPLVGIFALAFVGFQSDNFFPMLANGIQPVMMATYHNLAFFGLVASVFLVLYPSQKHSRHGYRTLSIAVGMIAFVYLINLVSVIGAMGPLAQIERFPVLEVVRYVRITEGVVERMDAFILFLWLAAGYVKTCVFFYASVATTAEALNLRAYQPLTFPFAILIVVLAIKAFPSVSFLTDLLANQLIPPFLIIEFALPASLLVVALIKRKLHHADS